MSAKSFKKAMMDLHQEYVNNLHRLAQEHLEGVEFVFPIREGSAAETYRIDKPKDQVRVDTYLPVIMLFLQRENGRVLKNSLERALFNHETYARR